MSWFRGAVWTAIWELSKHVLGPSGGRLHGRAELSVGEIEKLPENVVPGRKFRARFDQGCIVGFPCTARLFQPPDDPAYRVEGYDCADDQRQPCRWQNNAVTGSEIESLPRVISIRV